MDPDWHKELPPDDRWQIDYLDELEDLRINDPVLWLIVTGHKTSEWIAKKLGWPHDTVLTHLRQYKERGYLYDYEAAKGIHWALCVGIFEDLLTWYRSKTGAGGWCNRTDRNDE